MSLRFGVLGCSYSTDMKNTTKTNVTECDIEKANDCLATLGHMITKVKVNRGKFDGICNIHFPQARACVAQHTKQCSTDLKGRAALALQYVGGLMGGACGYITTTPPPTPPPICDTTAARMCVVSLWETIQIDKDTDKACGSVHNTTECVRWNTTACDDLEKQTLNETLYNVIKLLDDKCDKNLTAQCNNDKSITVQEGGPAMAIHVELDSSPMDLCGNEPDCKVYLDFVSEVPKRGPKCADGTVYQQYVLSGPSGGGSQDGICSREITSQNWKERHVTMVTAKIDHKIDGTVEEKLTVVLRKVVNGVEVESRILCEYTIVVVDHPHARSRRVCQSLNDPHITTFDGLKMNIHMEGWFYMYRHRTLPYEIHAAFQRCGPATCNCGIAVKAADTVFVIDQCRIRTAYNLKTMNAKLYYHNKVTPGFKVMSYLSKYLFIALPHGTYVRIALGYGFNLAIWASPYDWHKTEGICGNVNSNTYDDLKTPSGAVLSVTRTGQSLQTQFGSAWRVPTKSQLVNGVSTASTYTPPTYCECGPKSSQSDGAPANRCGADLLLESCTAFPKGAQDTTDKFPNSLRTIPQRSYWFGRRYRRAVEANLPDYDFDLDYALEDTSEPMNGWTEAKAILHCQEVLVEESQVVQLCQGVPNFDTTYYVGICAMDIMTTGDTEWTEAHLHQLKLFCLELVKNNENFTSTQEGALLTTAILDLMCLNDCSGHGICSQEVCRCDIGYHGDDCSISNLDPPQITDLSDSGLCDLRCSVCDYVSVYGHRFSTTDICHITSLEETLEGVWTRVPPDSVADTTLITYEQITCQVTDHVTSDLHPLLVELSNTMMGPWSNGKTLIVYDSMCHDCIVVNDTIPQCTRKDTGCFIDKRCYEDGAVNIADTCQLCRESENQSDWSTRSALQCKKLFPLYICLILLVLLIVAIIVASVVLCRRRSKAEQYKSSQAPLCCDGEPYFRSRSGASVIQMTETGEVVCPTLVREMYDHSYNAMDMRPLVVDI